MNAQMIEDIEKAEQGAGMLVSDIREAYSRACNDNQLLHILLLDLIADASRIRARLKEILSALES